MLIVPEVTNTCYPAHTNSTAQLRIDEKIAHLKECIRHLKSQRNGLTPISRLPPEILSSIFYFASAGRTGTSPIFPCYYFTHVSRSWRSVALNTPNLWQVLPHSIPWATAMLERSKGADLVVGSTLSSSSDHPWVLFFQEVLTKHTSRIRELDLSIFITPTFCSLFKELQQSLRLRSLKLTDFFGNRRFPIGVIEIGHLRTLAVSGCCGPWWSLLFPPLTNLKLHQLFDRPPLVKFLEMLRGLPALEVLDMHNSLPLAQEFVGSIGPVELPRLSHLCLSSTSDHKEVTNLLPIIIVPPTTTLKFHVEEQQSLTIQQYSIILDELASSVSTFLGRDTSYSNLDLFSEEDGHLHLKAWKDDGRISVEPHLELIVSLCSSNSIPNVLQAIFPSLPSMVDITTSTLDIVPTCTLRLEDTFGQLSNLQNVNVVGNCTIEFIQALTFKPENDNTEHAYYPISFLALQSLWIRDFCFERHDLQNLRDCLMERYERRAELLKLKISACFWLEAQDVEILRDIVSDVEWDGRTQ